jgi:hypothetical protein
MQACWQRPGSLQRLGALKGRYELVGFPDPHVCILKSEDNFLRWVSLGPFRHGLCFPHAVDYQKVSEGHVLALFSDNRGIGLQTNRRMHILPHFQPPPFIPTMESQYLEKLSEGDVFLTPLERPSEALPINREGFVTLVQRKPLRICSPGEPLPTVYNIFPEQSLFLVGYSQGLVKGFSLKTGKICFQYQAEGRITYLTLMEKYLVVRTTYGLLKRVHRINLVDRETQKSVLQRSQVDDFFYFEGHLVYCNDTGDVLNIDLNTLREQTVFRVTKGRGDFPNQCIKRAQLMGHHLITIRQNGTIVAHDLLTSKTIPIHATPDRGVCPYICTEDFQIIGNYLTAHIDNELYVFLLSTFKLIHTTVYPCSPLFLFQDELVCRFEDRIDLLSEKKDVKRSLAPSAIGCFSFEQKLLIVSADGNISFTDGSKTTSIYSFKNGLRGVHLNDDLLICAVKDPEKKQDRIVILKLSSSKAAAIVQEFTLSFKNAKKNLSCHGIQSQGHLILTMGEYLIVMNLQNYQVIFQRGFKSPIYKIIKMHEQLFMLETGTNTEKYSFDPAAKEPVENLRLEAPPRDLHFYHQRFLVADSPTGDRTVYDVVNNGKTRFKSRIPSEVPGKNELNLEFKNDQLITLSDSNALQFISLRTGESQTLFNNQPVLEWCQLDDQLLLIFKSGRISLMDTQKGTIEDLFEGLENQSTQYICQDHHFVVYFNRKTMQTDHSYQNKRPSKMGIIHYNLSTRKKTTWLSETQDILQKCFLFNYNNYILLEFLYDDVDGYYSYRHCMLNANTTTKCDINLHRAIEAILWDDAQNALLQLECSIEVYNFSTKKTTELLSFPRCPLQVPQTSIHQGIPEFLIECDDLNLREWFLFNPLSLKFYLKYPPKEKTPQPFYDEEYDTPRREEFSCTHYFNGKKLVWEEATCHLFDSETNQFIFSQDFVIFLKTKK